MVRAERGQLLLPSRAICLLVILSRDVKPPEEDVGIPQIAVGSSFSGFVPKLFGNGKSLE